MDTTDMSQAYPFGCDRETWIEPANTTHMLETKMRSSNPIVYDSFKQSDCKFLVSLVSDKSNHGDGAKTCVNMISQIFGVHPFMDK